MRLARAGGVWDIDGVLWFSYKIDWQAGKLRKIFLCCFTSFPIYRFRRAFRAVTDLNTETSIAVVTETQYNLVRFEKLWLVGCAVQQAVLISHFELDI
jgi:hypothetical protein